MKGRIRSRNEERNVSVSVSADWIEGVKGLVEYSFDGGLTCFSIR